MKHNEHKTHKQHLFYLHGQIVEGTDGNPRSPKHGAYQYYDIIDTFNDLGFHVISEIRPINCNVSTYAQKVAAEIRKLLENGVPADSITVLGASKGGMIAATVSHILKHPHIRYVILAGLFPALFEKSGVRLYGDVLSIHDSADKFPNAPDIFFENSPGLSRYKKVVTDTGLGHGLLYKPYSIWTEEVLAFIGIHRSSGDQLLAEQQSRC